MACKVQPFSTLRVDRVAVALIYRSEWFRCWLSPPLGIGDVLICAQKDTGFVPTANCML